MAGTHIEVTVIMKLLDHWRNGIHYGFPVCCRVQFLADQVVMGALTRTTPEALHDILYRLRRFTPRYSLADGLVPCSYHAARWTLTGLPPVDPASRDRATACCESRDALAQIADVHLVHLVLDEVDGSGSDKKVSLWVLRSGEGPTDNMLEQDVHIHNCPWCGTPL